MVFVVFLLAKADLGADVKDFNLFFGPVDDLWDESVGNTLAE